MFVHAVKTSEKDGTICTG